MFQNFLDSTVIDLDMMSRQRKAVPQTKSEKKMTKEKELKNKNVIKKVDGKIKLKRESSDQESGNKK